MQSRIPAPTTKIITWDKLQAWRQAIADAGGTLAVVTGTFALWHPGNLAAIREAKRQATHVLVIIHPDAPVSRDTPSDAATPAMAARLEMASSLRDVAASATCPINNAAAAFNCLRPYALVDGRAPKQSGGIALIARNLAERVVELAPIAGCFTADIREAIRNHLTPITVPDASLGLQPTRQDLDRFLKAGVSIKPLVTVNGCFDILHLGHVRLLAWARNLGARLLVLVNDDDSVRNYKGAGRPVFPVRFRLQALNALDPVSMAYPFAGDNPLSLLAAIRPDIHVKGGSFEETRVREEKRLVESWGGRLATIPLVDGFSTSNVLKQMAGN